jgi:ABC-2 type transport system permease protein
MLGLEAIYVITLRDLKKFIRDKPRIVGSVVTPAMWLLIMGTGFNTIFTYREGTYTQFMFPGIIAMTVLFTSLFSSISVIWDRQFGFLKEILVAPIPRVSIALGKCLSGVAQSIIQAAIMLGFSPLVNVALKPTTVVAVFSIVLLSSLAITSLGLFLAAMIETHEGFNVIVNFIVMPMFFLSGALFPISLLPGWLKGLVVMDPLTYGVDLLRGVMLGEFAYPIFLNITVLSIFTAVMNLMAVYSFSHRL